MRFRCKSNPSTHTPDSNLAEKRKSGFQNFANLRPWILNLRMRSESQCNMCACPSAEAGTQTWRRLSAWPLGPRFRARGGTHVATQILMTNQDFFALVGGIECVFDASRILPPTRRIRILRRNANLDSKISQICDLGF